MSDHVAIMNQGRFEQIGTPQELYFEPHTAFVADFVGEANRWRGEVHQSDGADLVVSVEGGVDLLVYTRTAVAKQSVVEVFVRPEAVGLSREQRTDVANQLQCTVQDILFNGANTQVLLRELATGHTLAAALPGTGDFLTIRRGDTLFAHWDRRHTRCFETALVV